MARASAFQAEGRGFESRLPLHFFLFELGFPKIRITGRMELCSPAPVYTLPIRLFIPIRTWVSQDSNYGQGGALLFLFELGFPKIRITAGLLPCTKLYPSYSNLGSPRFELRAGWSFAPLHQSIYFLFDHLFLFELGFPKIRMTGRVELRSSAPIYTLPIRLFVPIRTWVARDSRGGGLVHPEPYSPD